jgi:hypothetical protein
MSKDYRVAFLMSRNTSTLQPLLMDSITTPKSRIKDLTPSLGQLSDLSFEISPFRGLLGSRFPAVENIVHHIENTTGQPVP